MRLHHVQVSCPRGGEDAARRFYGDALGIHPAFLVDDIDGTAQRVAEHGFAVTWDDDFPGYRRFYTADGNGNRVEILAER